ncbi:MAG: DUF4349 domain-containing protein [Bacteroidota bacterium]|nr:DUF4349 domain-containing protein [Bacteroidota bacterium]
MKTMYSLILAIVMFSSCSGNKSGDYNGLLSSPEQSVSSEMSPPPPPSPSADGAMNDEASIVPEEPKMEGVGGSSVSKANSTVERIKIPEKIKKTADLNITVDDYKKARTEIEKIVKSGNAYIGSENEQNTTYSITNYMVIRVLNRDFDSMVNKLLTVARNVNSKSVAAEDVTARFVDIQSRLKSKKEIENRYLDILQRASKVSDILEIEQKLGEIREEIEAKEGELKFLSDQVNYSTINLNFHQEFEYTPTDRPGFFGRMGSAFGNGWSGFLSFLVGVVYVWPLWLILGLTAYLLVKFIKRQSKKK